MKSLLILILFMMSCGEFNFSPYVVKTRKLNLNQRNLDRLAPVQALSPASLYPYKVAVISDTHDYYDQLEKQIKFINNNNFQMTLVSGDMTNVGLVSEYEAAVKRLNRLKNPYLTTSGNHDLLINGTAIYKDYFGDDNYSFTIDDVAYIFMNNNNWESVVVAPNLSWFETELIKHSGRRIIVIAHCPYDDGSRFSSAEITAFENLLTTYNVDYFLNGHRHSPKDDSDILKTFKSVTVGSSSKNVVFELEIDSGSIGHKFNNI